MHRSPEVSRPPSATVPRRATPPGDASSGSSCVPAVPAGLDALLPPRSPRCLHRARSRGSTLQGLIRRRSGRLSTPASPPAIGGRSLSRAGPRCRGFIPPTDWEASWGFLPRTTSRPSWAFASLGLSPLPVSDRRFPGSPPFPFRGPGAAGRRSSSPAFRDSPVSGSVPSAPEYQRTVESADLFRGCRPLRGFRPRPPCRSVSLPAVRCRR
jgi:hypothetical protein